MELRSPSSCSNNSAKNSLPNSACDDYERCSKQQVAQRFFTDYLADENELANPKDLADFLSKNGLLPDDPRLQTLYQAINEKVASTEPLIDVEEYVAMLVRSSQTGLLGKAFRHELVVPEFDEFVKNVNELYASVKASTPDTLGHVATYIPQLAKVNPSYFGISVCTIDGQRYSLGDSKVNFSVQSCCKPLLYCLALEEHGEHTVHKHVGREPSGVAFNSLCLNSKNLPHNPMINAGAIMSSSLICSGKPLYERFEYLANKLADTSGGFNWGFSNSIYLSEKISADQNFCLAYMMRKNQVFPSNTHLEETLDLYFQACSLETNCDKLAIAGATIANGGVCPLTGKRIFSRMTCRNCLSLMYSCGMYDYSGEWAFTIGIPAKSGVSGAIFAVIPDFGCISVYAPPLDEIGNSVRGVEFFKQFVSRYVFHNFDTILEITVDNAEKVKRIDPRKNKAISERENKVAALYAAAEGDLFELRRLLLSGVSANVSDYDRRSLLHLAASEGHFEIVKYLVKRQSADPLVRDRWGNTPLDDARRYDHKDIVTFFERKLERSDSGI